MDLVTWEKASEPLYKAGGHPMGLDACEAHKVWLTGSGKPGDDTLYSASSPPAAAFCLGVGRGAECAWLRQCSTPRTTAKAEGLRC